MSCWIVRHRPWANMELSHNTRRRPELAHPGFEKLKRGYRPWPFKTELGTKTPSSEALELMRPRTYGDGLSFQFPTYLGDLIWLDFDAGVQLLKGMKCLMNDLGDWGNGLFLYPEPAQLRERLALLEKETKAPFELEEIKRFVGIYEAAYRERTYWVKLTEIRDDHETEYVDETEYDDEIDPPLEDKREAAKPTELPGEEVEWRDLKLMSMKQKTRRVPGGFHREPVIILHP